MKILGIIPARLKSSRLSEKLLRKIGDKTILHRVYLQSLKCADLTDVVIATDSEKIKNHALSFGAKVLMTSPEISSGTERCQIAITQLDTEYDAIVNIQGDEPFISPKQISDVANMVVDSDIATLAKQFDSDKELSDSNNVKVVFDENNFALYFSRSIIPFIRNKEDLPLNKQANFYKHIGLYAYKAKVLNELVCLEKNQLEIAESLEQLRWLANGYKIAVGITDIEGIGIDTEEDLELAKKFIK